MNASKKGSEEEDIRAVIQEWLEASRQNDLDRVLALTSPDVLFQVPGTSRLGEISSSRSHEHRVM